MPKKRLQIQHLHLQEPSSTASSSSAPANKDAPQSEIGKVESVLREPKGEPAQPAASQSWRKRLNTSLRQLFIKSPSEETKEPANNSSSIDIQKKSSKSVKFTEPVKEPAAATSSSSYLQSSTAPFNKRIIVHQTSVNLEDRQRTSDGKTVHLDTKHIPTEQLPAYMLNCNDTIVRQLTTSTSSSADLMESGSARSPSGKDRFASIPMSHANTIDTSVLSHTLHHGSGHKHKKSAKKQQQESPRSPLFKQSLLAKLLSSSSNCNDRNKSSGGASGSDSGVGGGFNHIPLERFKTIEPSGGAFKHSLDYRMHHKHKNQSHITIHTFNNKNIVSRLAELSNSVGAPSSNVVKANMDEQPDMLSQGVVSGYGFSTGERHSKRDRGSFNASRPASRPVSLFDDLEQSVVQGTSAADATAKEHNKKKSPSNLEHSNTLDVQRMELDSPKRAHESVEDGMESDDEDSVFEGKDEVLYNPKSYSTAPPSTSQELLEKLYNHDPSLFSPEAGSRIATASKDTASQSHDNIQQLQQKMLLTPSPLSGQPSNFNPTTITNATLTTPRSGMPTSLSFTATSTPTSGSSTKDHDTKRREFHTVITALKESAKSVNTTLGRYSSPSSLPSPTHNSLPRSPVKPGAGSAAPRSFSSADFKKTT